MWRRERGKIQLPKMRLAAIQSGDLLGWRKDSQSTISDLLIRGIKYFTNEVYGHVGIAWRCHDGINDELFVIEASIPKIRVSYVMPSRDFLCVPMKIDWNLRSKRFLTSKIGLDYSVMDAWRAYCGTTLKDDNRFQCAELADHFYRMNDIELKHDFRPGGIMRAAANYIGVQPSIVVP